LEGYLQNGVMTQTWKRVAEKKSIRAGGNLFKKTLVKGDAGNSRFRDLNKSAAD